MGLRCVVKDWDKEVHLRGDMGRQSCVPREAGSQNNSHSTKAFNCHLPGDPVRPPLPVQMTSPEQKPRFSMLAPQPILKGATQRCRVSCVRSVPALARTILGPGNITWNEPLHSIPFERETEKHMRKCMAQWLQCSMLWRKIG